MGDIKNIKHQEFQSYVTPKPDGSLIHSFACTGTLDASFQLIQLGGYSRQVISF